MQYRGSKNRLSKHIVPIIQSYITEDTKGYIEPFVGGANIIDKINCGNKIGYDIHKELIALLNHTKITTDDFPDRITEEEYNLVKSNKNKYEDWFLGLVGFCSTYSNLYFGTYARGNDKRIRSNEAIRNIKKQSKHLKDVKFEHRDFRDIGDIEGYVIYCDPPYKNTTKYSVGLFPHEEFYNWCRKMSKKNIVLISEYDMPNDFECIWEKDYSVNINSKRKESTDVVERLFIIR